MLTPDHNPVTLAYLAGFFDGEGSIFMTCEKPGNWHKRPHYKIEASFCNCDMAPLELAEAVFGGRIASVHDKRSGNKPVHRLRLCSTKARAALEAMLPYLLVKRERALLAIEFQTRKSSGKNVMTDEEMSAYRHVIQSMNDKVWNRAPDEKVNAALNVLHAAVHGRAEANVGDCAMRSPRKAAA